MFRMFMRFKGWGPLIPLAIGAGIIYVGTTISDMAEILAKEGVDATATVIEKKEITSLPTANNAGTTDYYVRYYFPLGDGTLHYDRRSVDIDFYDEVEVGMEIPVRFLTANPDTNEIETGAVSDNAFAAMAVGAAVALGGVLWLWFVVQKTLRAVAAVKRGIRAQAVVTKVVKASGANHLLYTFQDRQGDEREGRSFMGRESRIADLRKGDAIHIRYDPNMPKRAYWERDLGLEAGH